MRSQYDPSRHSGRGRGAPRRRDYQRGQARDAPSLQAAVERLAGEWPTDGARRLTALLRRAPCLGHHKRVARLMRGLGRQGPSPTRRPRTTNSPQAYPRDRHRGPRTAPRHTRATDTADPG